jgi:hypothetical protein
MTDIDGSLFLGIESAPKSGAIIELLVNGRVRPGFWSEACSSWMVMDEHGGAGECFPEGWRYSG